MNPYPDLQVISKDLNADKVHPIAILFLLNNELIDTIIGYEYLLNRGSYLYKIIKDEVNEKYPYYNELWLSKYDETVSFFYPPYSTDIFTKLPFMVIVAASPKQNLKKCETFYNLISDNFYYKNNFKFISVIPEGRDALNLIIPKPYEKEDDPLKEEYYGTIENINQFEQYYNKDDKDDFYRLAVQKLYQSHNQDKITLMFAGTQIGCLHAKVATYAKYGFTVLLLRFGFIYAIKYEEIIHIYKRMKDDEGIYHINNIIYDMVYISILHKIVNLNKELIGNINNFEEIYTIIKEDKINHINHFHSENLRNENIYNTENIGNSLYDDIYGFRVIQSDKHGGGHSNYKAKYENAKKIYTLLKRKKIDF